MDFIERIFALYPDGGTGATELLFFAFITAGVIIVAGTGCLVFSAISPMAQPKRETLTVRSQPFASVWEATLQVWQRWGGRAFYLSGETSQQDPGEQSPCRR